VPISLLFNPPNETVEDRFDLETLPMISIFRRDDHHRVDEAALDAVVEALSKRVDRTLFRDPSLARELARLSGGC
jgi:hypothetical protein